MPKNETYRHYAAKKIFKHWFVSEEKRSKDFCSVAQFTWRVNYGIYDELPWHETDDLYYFECSEGIAIDNKTGAFLYNENGDSYFDPDFDRGRLLFIPDITVFHKGVPKYFFEIVNSNCVSEKKLKKIIQFFGGSGPSIFEISANYILDQQKPPTEIKANCVWG